MASIMTGIQLQDNFSRVLYDVVGAVNFAVSSMMDMQDTMSAGVDFSSFDSAREQLNDATMAIQQMNEAVERMSAIQPPTPEPIQWHTDNLDVYTSTGMERFQQEVQGTNIMLQQLCSTQDNIARQAYNTTIFPPQAFQDLNSMAVRMDNIRDRIQLISSNPINMETDIANTELERLRSQLNQAVVQQSELNEALQSMDVSAANDAYLRLSQIIRDTEQYIRDNVDEQGQFNDEISNGVDEAGNLRDTIIDAVSAFAGFAALQKAVSWVEECTAAFDAQRNAEMQLMTVLANTQPIEGAFDLIAEKAAEIESRGIYGGDAMIGAAAEFATYFTDTDAITMMMDTLTDYAMGMSGGGAIDNTQMVNYATNLGKIMSGSYEAMTDKGFKFTEAQQAIIEGTATQQQIISAIGEEYLNMSADMQAAAAITQVIDESWAELYENMSNTPQGKIIQLTNAWGNMQTVIGNELYPYVILFVNAIINNWGTIETVLNGITFGLQAIMGILSHLLDGALKFANAIIDNWSVISPIIWGIVAAMGTYNAILFIGKIIQAACAAVTAFHTAMTSTWTVAIFAQTVAQQGLNAALAACPITWVIGLIIVLIGAIYAACSGIAKAKGIAQSGFGVICGCANVSVAVLKNLGMVAANVFLGMFTAAQALTYNLVTAFHNSISNVQSMWYLLLATALTVISGICAELNRLPFIEFDYSGITNAAADYASKALELQANKEDYVNVFDAFNIGFSTFDAFQEGWASDAFEQGAAWGDEISNQISDFIENLWKQEDEEDTDYFRRNSEDFYDNINSIADDTAGISDSLDISAEDLKYLRDLAEQEAVNRFTTAEIHVEMNTTNNINKDADLDGIVDGLTTKVLEAMEAVQEGV